MRFINGGDVVPVKRRLSLVNPVPRPANAADFVPKGFIVRQIVGTQLREVDASPLEVFTHLPWRWREDRFGEFEGHFDGDAPSTSISLSATASRKDWPAAST